MVYYNMYKLASMRFVPVSPFGPIMFGPPIVATPLEYFYGLTTGKSGTPKEKKRLRTQVHIGNTLIGAILSGYLHKGEKLPLKYAIPLGFSLPLMSSGILESSIRVGESQRDFLDSLKSSIRQAFGK